MIAEEPGTALRSLRIFQEHLRPLAEDMLARVDVLARNVTDRIHHQVSEVAGDPELAAETLISAEANISLLLCMLRDGVDPANCDPPAAALAQARQYVQRGGELTALLRTYRVGHAQFWALWLPELSRRITDPELYTEAVDVSSAAFFAYVDTISSQLVEVFSVERERWIRSAAALRADTVRAVLAGDFADAATASRRLRYDLARSHCAFVVWTDPTEQDVLGILEEQAARLAAALGGRTSLLVPMGRLLMAGWVEGTGGTSVKPPARAIDAPVAVRFATGSPGRGLDGFCSSYLQAMHARRLAELTGRPVGSVTAFRDVALLAMITADAQVARWFVEQELGPLAEEAYAGGRIAETVTTYLEEASSLARAAERLNVHKNTVGYRVRQAEEILGYRVEERRVEIGVALAAARVLGSAKR